jgi:hypothetical protein
MTGVLALYMILAALCTRPLLELSQSHIAGDPGDPVLNASILWWNATTLPFSEQWWNPPYFHLTKGVSAFSENLVGISPIATPLYWITRNPLTSYNVTLFLTWPLSAFAVYLLVRYVVGREDAALVAGLAYGFTPYRTAEMGHIQMVASFWIPLALLGLHGYLRERRAVWLILFGAGWLLQSLANGYLMLYGAVLIGLWLIYFCSTRESWRATPAVLVAWVLWSLPLVPVMLKYHEVHEYYGLRRDLTDVVSYSVPARAWFEVTDFVWLWRHVLPDGKDDLFPGVTALTLVLLAVFMSVRRRSPEHKESSSSGRRLLLGTLAAATAIGLTVVVYTVFAGPWRVDVSGVVIRVSDIDRPLAIALLCGLPFLRRIFTPGVRGALARRSPFVFYTGATIAMAVLSCGPVIPVGNAIVFDDTPYSWLMYVPGFRELRVPSRFWMLGVLCLAIAAGLAYARLRVTRRSLRILACLCASAGILLDGWLREMPMAVAPDRRLSVERRDDIHPILELPHGPQRDAAATFRSIWHRRGVFNGVSGYDPMHYLPLQEGLSDHDPAMLLALSSFGSFDVVVDDAEDTHGEWARYVTGFSGTVRMGHDGTRTVYRVPAGSMDVSLGAPLPIARAYAFLRDATPIADGRAETEWGDAPQRAGQWVSVDLGVVREIGGITHALGPYGHDFPRRLAIDVSMDGATWDQVWEGSTVAQAFRAAVLAPRAAVMHFAFAPRSGRFVRLRQLAGHLHPWRVAEVQVHAPRD